MTKRERVLACLARKTAVDHTARGLADAMLAFHRRFDLDILKVMSSGVTVGHRHGGLERAGAMIAEA